MNESPASQMELTSPAFDDGDRIPTSYGYTRDDVSPPLQISGVPDEAESLVLIMDDPDAMEPAGQIWDHWIVYAIAPRDQDVAEDTVPSGGVAGMNSYGDQGYGGPNPPGPGAHVSLPAVRA